jgi:hypothetical protein
MGHKGGARWSRAEWDSVACAMLPLLTAGREKIDALRRAMNACITPSRHHGEKSLQFMTGPKYIPFNSAIERARKMTDTERIITAATQAAGLTCSPSKSHVSGIPRGHKVTWTRSEWALLARMVMHLQRGTSERSLPKLVARAQGLVLDPDRHRLYTGIYQSFGAGSLTRNIEQGKNDAWLIKAIPFVPPELARQALAQTAVAQAVQAAIEAPQGGLKGLQATTPAPTPEKPQERAPRHPAIAAFGEQLLDSLEAMLKDQAAFMNAEIERRVGMRVTEAVQTMETNLGRQVRALLEIELGPLAQPAKPAEVIDLAPPDVLDPESEAARKLRVDVVGLKGAQQTLVRQAFNGETDLRFVPADNVGGWKPNGRHVILVTKFISHDAEDKAKASSRKPVRVNGAARSVIAAIKKLHAQEGIPLSHH